MGAAGAATAPECGDGPKRVRLLGLLRVPGGAEAGSDGQLEELEREVALLREENARLKLAREHAEDSPLNERLRAALAAATGGERDADGEEPWEVLTECMLLRETMLDACRELERGAAELRTRLETLLADGSAERSSSDLERVT